MFKHYFKTALRNIRKYTLQNIVSMLGLALGFVCLSLSIIWIRYENSFDTFHKDAERIYTVSRYQKNEGHEYHGVSIDASKWRNLVELPEIEDYTQFNKQQYGDIDAVEWVTDAAFYQFFDIKVKEGTDEFKTDFRKVAITRNCAERLFPGRNPIGETFNWKTICAVLEDFPSNTALMFDALSVYEQIDDNGHLVFPKNWSYGHNQFFKTVPGTDVKTFTEKAEQAIRLGESDYYRLLPITDIHRQTSKNDMYIDYEDIRLFCLTGIVLFICAMVNFVLFSLVRLDYRKKEMALRIVNGSYTRNLFSMLIEEYCIILLMAMVLGLVFNILIAPIFSDISDIGLEPKNIVAASLEVMLPVIAIALTVCAISVWSVRRNNMQASIAKGHGDGFRRVCIGIQLFIGIFFIFIVSVMFRQFGVLRNHDWGVRVNNTAVLTIYNPDHISREQISMSWGSSYYPMDDDAGQKANTYTYEIRQHGWGYNVMGDEYLNQIDGRYGLSDKLKQLPYLTGFYKGFGDGTHLHRMAQQEASSHERTVNGHRFNLPNSSFITLDILNTDALDFMDLTVIDGSIPARPVSDDELVITENLQKELGLGPVSSNPMITIEHFYGNSQQFSPSQVSFTLKPVDTGRELSITYSFRVIAIVKDVYLQVFNLSQVPMYAFCSQGNRRILPQNYSFRGHYTEPMITLTYQEGKADRLKSDVAKLMADANLDYDLTFSEDRFFESLKSQRHLAGMIMVVGGVCILICLFGIWSMVMLACQERRREIAVRKVHGARKRDIQKIFIKDYSTMLVVTSALAFASGYIIMHHWLQQFEQRTAICWWIYVLIFVGMALVISLTVLHRVTKAASENPSVVIKNE